MIGVAFVIKKKPTQIAHFLVRFSFILMQSILLEGESFSHRFRLNKYRRKIPRNGFLLIILVFVLYCLLKSSCIYQRPPSKTYHQNHNYVFKAIRVLSNYTLKEAERALQRNVLTITSFVAPQSPGGKHDFYSEGDYWWPDLMNPYGPYIRRDGIRNPANFVLHRLVMIRFSRIIGALASAYRLTGNDEYVKKALVHLRAWFINADTLMNPQLLLAQSVKGWSIGREFGIIDTIQLIEVAQGVKIMQDSDAFDPWTFAGVKAWFALYLDWLITHPFGLGAMRKLNNHATCWVMQVASFATLTGNRTLMEFCRYRFKTVLLPNQMADDGSFPQEIARTRPYSYSIFNLDAMSMICQILSNEKENLWDFETFDGKSVKKGIEFMSGFLSNKSTWIYPADVTHWDDWPVAAPFLLFGAAAYDRHYWFELWKRLDHQPICNEVIRNLPVRHPLIWF